MFSKFFKRKQKTPEPPEVYNGLRNQIFGLNPNEAGIQPSEDLPNVWGVLMETGYSQAVVTLVSLADGTASLYFSSGGGMIGGGEHDHVAQASKSFVAATEDYYQKMLPTKLFPSPTIGRVSFTFSPIRAFTPLMLKKMS